MSSYFKTVNFTGLENESFFNQFIYLAGLQSFHIFLLPYF